MTMERKKTQAPPPPAPGASGAGDEAGEILRRFDRESNTRLWSGWQKWAVSAVMAAFSLFVICVTLFASWLDLIRYPSFVGGVLLIGYLAFPARKGVQRVNFLPWYDWLLMLAGTAACFYVVINARDLTFRLGLSQLRPYETLIALAGIVSVLELCRRSVGVPILCVAGLFLLYALYYYSVPKGLSAAQAVRSVAVSLFYKVQGGGILGTPVQVCSKFIVVFIVFGAFLERTGISRFFIDLANALVGRFSGGPAKVAVISSALCGMVSGSSVGNTVTTGSVTIPMMKDTGYRGEFAGAVEAAASTGGQIMPPIMGAAAFLMAEYAGVPYSNIIVRAILPAILYFAGIFIAVHLEAKKLGLRGLPREKLPVLRLLLRRLYLLLPLAMLVYLVSSGSNTMAFSAAIAILFSVAVANARRDWLLSLVCVAALGCYLFLGLEGLPRFAMLAVGILSALLGLFRKGAVMSPAVFFDALAGGAKSSVTVAAACAVAGMIGGCITITGLASQLISGVIALSRGSVLAALFFTMLCCIVLGMGVPTTANYCIMASTCAPILIQLGIPVLAAHFFVFYFGIVADITPPVALAAYAGSAIAKSPPMKTAVNASKLAIAAFIVPYVFALDPSMLLIGTAPWQVLLLVASSLVGIFGVAAALNGYLFRPIGLPCRLGLAAGGLLMMAPSPLTDLIGAVLLAAAVLWQRFGKRAQPPRGLA